MKHRVVHVDRQRAWTGQMGRLLRVAAGTRDRGHDVRIIAPAESPLAERAPELGLRFLPLAFRGWRTWPAALALARHLRAEPADVLHAHGGRDHQVAWVARRLARVPFLVRTKHNHTPLKGGALGRRVYASTDRVVAVSDFTRELLLRDGIPDAKIRVVKTAFDLERVAPRPKDAEVQAELGLTDEHVVFGNVSRLAEEKGIEELLRAAALLRRQPGGERMRVVLAGNTPELWTSLVEELGLGDVVHLLPYRKDVRPLVSVFDVFVMPSREEALGTSLIEALAMGKAAIGARVGGIPETLVPGTGLLVPARDPQALAGAMGELLVDPERRAALAQAGREHVVRTYSLERLVGGTLSIYDELRAATPSA
ncbi:MAG: glycosyltransferase [Planctomycetota bacterium]